jgi:hypothetical protein
MFAKLFRRKEYWLVTYEMKYMGSTTVENVAYPGTLAEWMDQYVYSQYRQMYTSRESDVPNHKFLGAVRITKKQCEFMNDWGTRATWGGGGLL